MDIVEKIEKLIGENETFNNDTALKIQNILLWDTNNNIPLYYIKDIAKKTLTIN